MADRGERFADLYNPVHHPFFLATAFEQVARNTGSRTAGIDGLTARAVGEQIGVGVFLAGIAHDLREGTYLPVRCVSG